MIIKENLKGSKVDFKNPHQNQGMLYLAPSLFKPFMSLSRMTKRFNEKKVETFKKLRLLVIRLQNNKISPYQVEKIMIL
jgi:hypothetical protein